MHGDSHHHHRSHVHRGLLQVCRLAMLACSVCPLLHRLQDMAALLKKQDRDGGRDRRWRGNFRKLQRELQVLEEDEYQLDRVFPQVRNLPLTTESSPAIRSTLSLTALRVAAVQDDTWLCNGLVGRTALPVQGPHTLIGAAMLRRGRMVTSSG
jgi:hypothetical protein